MKVTLGINASKWKGRSARVVNIKLSSTTVKTSTTAALVDPTHKRVKLLCAVLPSVAVGFSRGVLEQVIAASPRRCSPSLCTRILFFCVPYGLCHHDNFCLTMEMCRFIN